MRCCSFKQSKFTVHNVRVQYSVYCTIFVLVKVRIQIQCRYPRTKCTSCIAVSVLDASDPGRISRRTNTSKPAPRIRTLIYLVQTMQVTRVICNANQASCHFSLKYSVAGCSSEPQEGTQVAPREDDFLNIAFPNYVSTRTRLNSLDTLTCTTLA